MPVLLTLAMDNERFFSVRSLYLYKNIQKVINGTLIALQSKFVWGSYALGQDHGAAHSVFVI
jgi:hypothetical protein